MVNRVTLVGRLGRDTETKFTGAGQAVANFSIATDETYKDKTGARQKRTEWHRIVVWGKQAEIAQQYLHKGSLIFVEGRIQTRQWDDREGQKRTTMEIVANNFRMLGGRAEGGMAAGASAGAGDTEPQAAAAGAGAGAEETPSTEISHADIPFLKPVPALPHKIQPKCAWGYQTDGCH